MEPIEYRFSRLTLKPEDTPCQNTALPDEVLFHIFSLLNKTNLNKASQICRAWRRVATDTRFWQRFIPQVYPEQAQVYAHLSSLAERPLRWHQFIQRQHLAAAFLRAPLATLTKKVEVLPDSPMPKRVYIDIDGVVYTALKGLQIEACRASEKTLFSLETLFPANFRNASLRLCSIRTIQGGNKIALLEATKKGIFGLRQMKGVFAYDLNLRCITWKSEPGASYVFSGGANLGIGWEPSVIAKTWSRKLCQSRQQLAEEAFSSTFCTTHKSANTPARHAFSIYRLSRSIEPVTTMHLPKEEVVQHVDSNLCGSFFFVTARGAAESRHILFARTNDGSYTQFSDVNVLAFDGKRSIAIIQFLGSEDAQAPIHLAHLTEQNGNITLRFHTLSTIPPAAQYSAQIKERHAAILLRGPAPATLFRLPLFQPDEPETSQVLLDQKIMPHHRISSFTLYDDILLLLTVKPDNTQGPLVVLDSASQICQAVIEEPVTGIIAREAQSLLCQTKDGLLAVNLNEKSVTKLCDGDDSRTYQSGIFSTGDPKPTLYELSKKSG